MLVGNLERAQPMPNPAVVTGGLAGVSGSGAILRTKPSWWSPWTRPFGATFSGRVQVVAHPDGGAWLVAPTEDAMVLSRWFAGADAPSMWTLGPAGALRDALALVDEGLLAVLVDGRVDLYML